MFLGIDRPEWFLLWSGVLGAGLSAGIAALVAVLVLKRSSEHQKALADRQREMSAMAELLAAASWFEYAPYDATKESISEQEAGFRAAVYRWVLETQEVTFRGELDRASQILAAGSLAALGSSNGSEKELCISSVQEMVSALTEFGLAWYAPDMGDRERSGDRLTMTIERLAIRLGAVLGGESETASMASL